MNFEDKVLALVDNGRRSAAYVAGYLSARARAAAIAAEADRLIAEMVAENAKLRERLSSLESLYRARDRDWAAKEAELKRVLTAVDDELYMAYNSAPLGGLGSSEPGRGKWTEGLIGQYSPIQERLRPTLTGLTSPAAEPSCVEWQSENVEPIEEGWYAVQRADGSLCIRAWGDGFWWSPLKDGWLSGLPEGFRWFGPLESLDWETPHHSY